MGFVQTHFIAFGIRQGMSAVVAAWLMGVMGMMSVAGGLALGALSDRLGRRDPLAIAYALRGLGLAAWLAVPVAPHRAALIYAGIALIGLSWAATISLTTAACADVWGSRAGGGVAGLSLLIMWLGHALGTYLPGLLASASGGYGAAIALNTVAAGAAALAIATLAGPSLRRPARLSVPS